MVKKLEIDDDGKAKTWTYNYDYENRLIKVIKQEEGETKTVTFKYDSFGRRIEKKVEEIEGGKSETKTYNYVYDNEDIILEYETKSDGKVETTRYVHGLGIDEPLSIEQKNQMYYYHADGLGSIVALTDNKQKVVQSYTYDSFGGMNQSGDKVKQPYTYTGREWDKEIKLYYNRERYRDPETGIFITKDPILHPANGPPKISACNIVSDSSLTPPLFTSLMENPQTLNPYVYVQNRPTVLIDPSGFGPNTECILYAEECSSGNVYACSAWWVCNTGWPSWGEPNSEKNSCVRNCLLDKYNSGCKDFICEFSAHLECFKKCENKCTK